MTELLHWPSSDSGKDDGTAEIPTDMVYHTWWRCRGYHSRMNSACPTLVACLVSVLRPVGSCVHGCVYACDWYISWLLCLWFYSFCCVKIPFVWLCQGLSWVVLNYITWQGWFKVVYMFSSNKGRCSRLSVCFIRGSNKQMLSPQRTTVDKYISSNIKGYIIKISRILIDYFRNTLYSLKPPCPQRLGFKYYS